MHLIVYASGIDIRPADGYGSRLTQSENSDGLLKSYSTKTILRKINTLHVMIEYDQI